MLFKIDGSSTIKAPRAIVFDFLVNPRTIGECLPDVQNIELLDAETFKAKVKTGISYIRGVFEFKFNITEKQAPVRATLKGHGTGRGSAIDLVTRIELNESEGGATTVNWASEAKISGSIAGVGSRILETSAGKLITLLFSNMRNELEQ